MYSSRLWRVRIITNATVHTGPKISQNVNYTQKRGTMDGPKAPSEAWRREAPRGGSGEGRRSPSPVLGSGGIAPRKFPKFNSTNLFIFPRFQDRDSISVRNLHCILLLHITHSSKVNCTLCVRKHNFRP